MNSSDAHIVLKKASVHNLQDIDLDIPHNQFVVITGVSGSGKSSLAFDTVCREGQRRYLESFSTRARQLLGKLGKAEVGSIDHLSAAIAVNQKTAVGNPRSTVGTMSELYDHLRLLFARFGESANPDTLLTRSLFSFNADGACPTCNGLGVTDHIDPDLLIKDPALTLREGALVITTDSGYIIYSQVTMDVLDEVCHAHDFHVDIPWREMTDEQKQIILYGSQRIKIAFGKHTLESRMKWSGITARPRPDGYYGGIVPVMEQILKRDRNKNILRFAQTGPCHDCSGSRLCAEAVAVTYQGQTIADYAAMTITELAVVFEAGVESAQVILEEMKRRAEQLLDLGLGYLTLDRAAPTLSGGEAQRIRLAGIVGSGLRGMTYVFDEPSVGLHPRDNARLLRLLRRLVDQGNSVIVVEHDEDTMLAADWLIDIGPGAGRDGGRVLYQGPPKGILAPTEDPSLKLSLTRRFLLCTPPEPNSSGCTSGGQIQIQAVTCNNLQGFDVTIPTGALTVVTGVSGAGKSSFLAELRDQARCDVDQLIEIDQRPIGRTPRSNAATYIGLFDHVRRLFAAQPAAKTAGLGAGQFSFNNKGGRCEQCLGAGVETVGMHFLGDVESECTACAGKRFLPSILAVTYRKRNISQVLEMSVAEAVEYFADEKKIHKQLTTLVELGLGYLPLGQPSTTLSGGEAQRIKLAAELSKARKGRALYTLDEPTSGLHAADVENLMRALKLLTAGGATVVLSEHHAAVIRAADCVVDLGPGSGCDGGRLLYRGPPAGLKTVEESVTGAYLFGSRTADQPTIEPPSVGLNTIALRGVRTHNLQNIDVDIPLGKITVMTGVSGSGKSSLAMATLCAEGRNRYAENFSTYMRQMLTGRSRPDLDSCRGLSPTIAISQNSSPANRRSTVATVSEIHPLFRLLMARFGEGTIACQAAADFSFNNHQAACPECKGLGSVTVPDEAKFITHPEQSLLDGAMDGHKTGRFYGEPDGQYTAALRTVGEKHGIDYSGPWKNLSDHARQLALDGTGNGNYDVVWKYQRGEQSGRHDFKTIWPGFRGHILQEYQRKHDDQRGQAMLAIMRQDPCPECDGARLSPSALSRRFAGENMADLCAMSVAQSLEFFDGVSITDQLGNEITNRLNTLADLGLSYLTLDRTSASLSTGESQRVRLARQLGARLRDITYILDEPTLGLHPRDIDALWRLIERLRDDGSTVVLVEHDLDIIRRADWVIDLGPGAGVHGGRVLVQGTPQTVEAERLSPTGMAMQKISSPRSEFTHEFGHSVVTPRADLIVKGAYLHNLQNIDVGFATGRMTAVIGVSGSGKSSLILGVLAATAEQGLPIGCAEINGLEQFDSVVSMRRSSSTAAPGSTIATSLSVMDSLRSLLAATETAKSLQLRKKHFATAQSGGRCESCKGRGQQTVSMDFLADVSRVCGTCLGTGFLPNVLQCRIHGMNLVELLDQTVEQAGTLFTETKKLNKAFIQLQEVGLGYLKLGQATGTLSGGERQRLHLARELLKAGRGTTLYLCDEPSAGLHELDVDLLARLFHKLVEQGHTVILTEHHQGLIAQAHAVVEMGGDGGGLCRCD